MLPGWLERADSEDGTITLLGPEPGPAGETALVLAPGLVICFDAADTRIVTRVEIDEDADRMDVANLLGLPGTELLASGTDVSEFLDDPDAALVRREVARLALLLMARNVPVELMDSPSWSFEALVLADRVADFGFDMTALLAAEAEVAAPALLEELGRIGPRPAAEKLAVRAAHIALRWLDPLAPLWFRLHEAALDLPDPSTDAWEAPAALDSRLRDSPGVAHRATARMLGEERPVVQRYGLLWSWVDRDLLPLGEAFAAAITAVFDTTARHVAVQYALRARRERAVFARLVERTAPPKVISVFALLFEAGLWQGDGPLPAGTDHADLRVEVVGSLGTVVLGESAVLRQLGAQWGRLALQAERQWALDAAIVRWMRSAEYYTSAGEDGAAATALRYAEDCISGPDYAELKERRQEPFGSELGPQPPET